MNGFKNRWNAMNFLERICTAVGLPCSIAVVVLAILQLTQVWQDAAYAYLPLMCITSLIQMVRFWKTARTTAVISLCAAAILLVCSVMIILLG